MASLSDGFCQKWAQPIAKRRRRRSSRVPGGIHHSPMVVWGAHSYPQTAQMPSCDLSPVTAGSFVALVLCGRWPIARSPACEVVPVRLRRGPVRGLWPWRRAVALLRVRRRAKPSRPDVQRCLARGNFACSLAYTVQLIVSLASRRATCATLATAALGSHGGRSAPLVPMMNVLTHEATTVCNAAKRIAACGL